MDTEAVIWSAIGSQSLQSLSPSAAIGDRGPCVDILPRDAHAIVAVTDTCFRPATAHPCRRRCRLSPSIVCERTQCAGGRDLRLAATSTSRPAQLDRSLG